MANEGRLYEVADRIGAVVECSQCLGSIKVSGNTFTEITEKLAGYEIDGEPAPIMRDDGPATCHLCQSGADQATNQDRDTLDDSEVIG